MAQTVPTQTELIAQAASHLEEAQRLIDSNAATFPPEVTMHAQMAASAALLATALAGQDGAGA